MYQSATICVPSGLIDGSTMLITLSRIAHRLLVGARQAVVDELGGRLRRRDFGRMQREALDGDRLAFGDELPALRPRGSRADRPAARSIWRYCSSFARLAGDEMKSAMYGRPSLDLAELDQLHAVRALGEQLVVLEQLVPVGELAIGAHLEAEELFGRCQRSWRRRLRVNCRRAEAPATSKAEENSERMERKLAFMGES